MVFLFHFRVEGAYNVKTKAYDNQNILPQETNLVVAYLPCKMPSVSILKQVVFKEQALQNWKSMALVVQGTAQFECTAKVPLT